MDYEFSPRAWKEIRKLSPEVAQRIIKKIDYFVSSPNPTMFAESLTNLEIGQYRFRIGDYRVTFDLEGEKILILKVGHRRDIYK